MSKRSPRLQFSDEEKAAPELKKAIQKAEKQSDKLDKAEAKSPRKPFRKSSSWSMPMARLRSICILKRLIKGPSLQALSCCKGSSGRYRACHSAS